MPPAAFARELREAGLAVDGRTGPDAAVQRADVPRAARRRLGSAVRDGLCARIPRGGGSQARRRRRARSASTPSSSAHPKEVDFERLELAARAVISGARLLTGSYVAAYAGANGPILSRGAMVTAAIAKASGRRPTIVGKPSRAAVNAIETHLGMPAAEIAVIGDDLLLDVALGHLGGSRTVLVRTWDQRIDRRQPCPREAPAPPHRPGRGRPARPSLSVSGRECGRVPRTARARRLAAVRAPARR